MVIMPTLLYCVCFLGILLQLQPVSAFEYKFDFGVRFRKQVNGIKFGPISMLSKIISNVSYAADDLMIPGNIVVAIGGVLKSYSPKTGIVYPIDISSNQSPLNGLRGFLQTSTYEILVVDYLNNCIVLVTRQKGDFNGPTLAGKCGEPNGYIDGHALDARFTRPIDIKESPTSYVFYVIEGVEHLRQINTIEKTVSTLFKYHYIIIDVILSASKEILYVANTCGILSYDINTQTLEQLPLVDKCGFRDGNIQSNGRFSTPYSMVLLNAFTMLLVDHYWNNLRVVDLCTNRTSTICIPTRDNTTFLVSEEPSSCTLTQPHTLIFSSALKAVIILSFQNSAILPIKNENFHCDPSLPIPEDKTRQHKSANSIIVRLNPSDVHFLPVLANEKRQLHYLCSSETAASNNMCFPVWCVTASKDERIELKFHSLRLPAGAELVIHDGMLVEDQSLILVMDSINANQNINKTVLSTGNHITFGLSKGSPALKSGFSLDYNTYGYIAPTEPTVANLEGKEHDIEESSTGITEDDSAADDLDENENDYEEASTGITDIARAVIVVMISMVLQHLHQSLFGRLSNRDDGNARIHRGLLSETNISGNDEGDHADNTTNDLGHDSGESNEFNSIDEQKLKTKSDGEDRYNNVKLKNTLADNNINPVQEASASDINLQLDDNKKCNIDYKKEKVIPEISD